jgi:hypothetical protein
MLEAEALIPLSMATVDTCIVLSGDDKQLGAYDLQSESARHHKFDKSIMERMSLLEDVYQVTLQAIYYLSTVIIREVQIFKLQTPGDFCF